MKIKTELWRKLLAFVEDLLIEVDGVPTRFGDVADPWQRADMENLIRAVAVVIGGKRSPADEVKLRHFLERPRGHDKTSSLAIIVCVLLAFAQRIIRGYGFGADREQAKLLLDAIERLIRINPFLAQILEVQVGKVANVSAGHKGEGSMFEIFASDIKSSYGILPDFMIADEFTHWQANSAGLWDSIISSAAKKKSCLMVVITNAGFIDDWQWKVREAIRVDKQWIFSRLDGPVASWITEDRLEEQRRLLPAPAFRRLWCNQYSSGMGDAVTEEVLAAAFKDDLKPMPNKLEGWEYVAGVDLGVTRDASAICVLGINKAAMTQPGGSRIRLCFTKVWKPIAGQPLNLQLIEDALVQLHRRYKFRHYASYGKNKGLSKRPGETGARYGSVIFDPWQAIAMAQRLSARGLPMEACHASSVNLQRQASTLIETFNELRIDLYPEPNLRRDLSALRVEEKPYGFRLVAKRDEHGHGDLGTAFSLALLAASAIAGVKTIVAGAVDDDGLSSWEQRQREHQEEMNFLAAGGADDTNEIFRAEMQRYGRF